MKSLFSAINHRTQKLLNIRSESPLYLEKVKYSSLSVKNSIFNTLIEEGSTISACAASSKTINAAFNKEITYITGRLLFWRVSFKTFSRDGSDGFRAGVSRRETADPTGLHIAARASIKSTAPQTILPGESDGIIFQPAGNFQSCMGA